MDEKIPDREAGDFSSVHAPVPAETTDFAGSCRPVFRRSGCPCRFAAASAEATKSSMKKINASVEKTTLGDIAGLAELKDAMEAAAKEEK